MFEIARENHYQLYTCYSVSAWILRIPNESVQALIAAVKTPLPITNLNDFMEFERAINEEPEKKTHW